LYPMSSLFIWIPSLDAAHGRKEAMHSDSWVWDVETISVLLLSCHK
jgi:hypothetical protein